jgi:hypothetical protein
MNKTLLLIIIDFLFLNLIALTHWEKAEPARQQQPPVPQMAANAATKDQDLVETMKQSLADETAARQALEQKLSQAGNDLTTREQGLSQLQAERAKLAASLAESQRNAQELDRAAQAAKEESSLTKEQLAQLQRDLEEKRAEADRQAKQLAALNEDQAKARKQIEGLTLAVVVGENEKQHLKAQAADLANQVQTERADRIKVQESTAQLAHGVGQLAENSGALTKEIRENRPINPNVLYNDFQKNRVETTFTATRKGLFGQVNKLKQTPTVFVTDGTQIYALLHLNDTAFSDFQGNYDWSKIGVAFDRPPSYHSEGSALEFLSLDPRVVVVPVTQEQAQALGAKIYPLAADPFKFPDAVLIDGEKGYGELSFKLDPGQPGFVRVDNRFFKRLFGDFSPRAGDLVFSHTGELLGIMVNRNYCALLRDFSPSATLKTGDEGKDQHPAQTLDSIAARIMAMPQSMQ